MMKILEALTKIKEIRYPDNSPQVVETVISEFTKVVPGIEKKAITGIGKTEAGVFKIAIASVDEMKKFGIKRIDNLPGAYIYLQIQENGSGWLVSSYSNFIYAFVCNLLENMLNKELDEYVNGKVITPAFKWQRISYDYFLTQQGRIQYKLDRASYIRELARIGFTHIEVNGLAYPMGLETGPKGETYPMFYTYCPALDQFVYSSLNKGLYSYYYLAANLDYLKENAKLAVKYGLTPGMLCFEPRSVPEEFFIKYPMLRGARVDHPFRSFKPRYNMTITHPKVRAHYAEMMKKIMVEVPEMGYLSIWTNDSGAGFEHTKSLYVGRNGGAYMIREWREDKEIARLAGENALRFFHTLRDTAKEVNPEFRVITRMESFYGEHDTVWKGLGKQVDIETNSLAAIGWEMVYSHPKYLDSGEIIGGSVQQQQFDEKEKEPMADLEKRDALPHFNFAVGPHVIFDPLMGVPVPKLTYQRLKLLYENGVKYLAHQGGSFPAELVPYNISHEIDRLFQYNTDLDIDQAIDDLATKWAGAKFKNDLIKAWELTEEAILAFPNVTGLYSSFGFSWYRLWERPLVPNIEAIPQRDRDYYENQMCTTPHNPNNVDLSRDVLFQLTTLEKSKKALERIDQNLWKPMDEAIQILSAVHDEANQQLGEKNVIHDQLIRLKALRCWFMTQRSVAAWVAGVHGYLQTDNKVEKKQAKKLLKEMIIKEIENTKELANLLDSDVEFMSHAGLGETPLMYGTNLKDYLPRRIELMKAHIDDEPYIDPNYIENKAGQMVG